MALHSTKQKEIIPVLIKFIHTQKRREQNPLNIILCDQCYRNTKKTNKDVTQMQKNYQQIISKPNSKTH